MADQNSGVKDCGRQFIENTTKKIIIQYQWDYVDKLLLEKLPIAGISRVTGISEPWLQCYLNKTYSEIDNTVNISKKRPIDNPVR